MPSQATVAVEATLDADELSFLKEAFKRSKRGSGRITVVHLVKCLEEMDYILDGDTRDFIRSVVPKAFEANELGLQDAIKVATSAKTQEGAGEIPVLGRDDSLAQLESSFQTQMQSGEIPETVAEEEPTSPVLDRDESLAQLERSFAKQLVSGDIPEVIVEKDENDQNGPAVGHTPVVHVDVSKRRSFPGSASRSWKEMLRRSDTLSVLQQQYPAGQEGPNPEVVDLPHRRASNVTHLGVGTLIGLDGAHDDDGDNDTTPPSSPELMKQTSEEALLETASDTLGVAPVEVSNVPKRRKSLPVSKSWSEAAAKAALAREEAAWIKREEAARIKREEVARTKHEEEAGVKVEVTACLAWLTREIQTKFDVKQEKENADRMAAEVLVELEHAKAAYARAEVETVLRLAIESLERGAAISAADAARKDAERMVQEQARTVAAEASARLREEASAREEAERKAEEAERKAEEAEERAKATYARAEVETVLRLAIESIERDAVISAADAARRDAERKVQEQAKTVAAEASARLREEASAREEAERKAEEAEERAKAIYARAEVETVLRLAIESLERDAVISAADAARKDTERKVQEQARTVAAEASARLREEASARGEAERKAEEAERKAEEALRKVALAKARMKEKEDALNAAFAKAEQREAEIRKEAQEARESQERKTASLGVDEERHHFVESDVSYETVDRGGPWWKCIACAAPPEFNEGDGRSHSSEVKRFDDGEENGEDYAAAVESIKPEMWIKSSGMTASTRSLRPDSSDVCSIM
ncbi:unnamed protein product [Ascophyllum nodosum]